MNRRKKLFKRAGIKRFSKSILADKRGSTLIEVIVSVLIVGIAFVPLMMGLNAALKVNTATEKELYAENVATNIVEITKTYGTKGMKKLADDQDADETKGIATILDEAKMVPNGLSGKKYTITNLKAGTGKIYQAEVEFSTFDNNQNDFSAYPAVEGIDGAIIVNFSETTAEWVVNAFKNQVGFHEDVSVTDLTARINEWIKREMIISIEKGTGEDNGKVIVKKVEKFYANADLGGDPIFPSGVTPTPVTKQSMEIGKLASLSSSLIVTHRPLRTKKGKDIYLSNDNIIIQKNVNGELHVYNICENGAKVKDKGYRVFIKFDDTSTDPNNYGYSNLNDDGDTTHVISGTAEFTFGGGTTGKQSNMKNVKITIMDKDGNTLFVKNTSIIEVE